MPVGSADLRIGTSGWNYPAGRGTWNGIFYPRPRGRAKGFDDAMIARIEAALRISIDRKIRRLAFFHQADIGDRARIAALLGSFAPDAVLHLAAESHVDRSIDGPGEFIKTNIDGTYALLDAALEPP